MQELATYGDGSPSGFQPVADATAAKYWDELIFSFVVHCYLPHTRCPHLYKKRGPWFVLG